MLDPVKSDSPEGLPLGPDGLPVPQNSNTGNHKTPGHGIWSWDINISIWIMIEDKSEPGFEAGPGPTGPGRFHGQTVRWASVPKLD
jgi:hypothetical protein